MVRTVLAFGLMLSLTAVAGVAAAQSSTEPVCLKPGQIRPDLERVFVLFASRIGALEPWGEAYSLTGMSVARGFSSGSGATTLAGSALVIRSGGEVEEVKLTLYETNFAAVTIVWTGSLASDLSGSGRCTFDSDVCALFRWERIECPLS